jgi:beta-lactam-binding protein with PASTA domain
MRIEEAVALLEEAGFDIDVSGYRPGRRVKEQDPERDEVVRRGARVHLFL